MVARAMPRCVSVLALLALGCAALAGCGGGDDDQLVILDTKKVERAIEETVMQKRGIKVDVDCPSGVHQAKGLTFRCVATPARGRPTTFVVDQVDDNGDVRFRAL